jgi:acyl-CoA thioester hydrolase
MRIQVGVRVDRIGNKSFEMAYSIQNADTEQELATGCSILVAYDYPGRQSVPLPDSWRSALEEFERSN